MTGVLLGSTTPRSALLEEQAKRLHRLDPAAPLVSWERLWMSAQERYRDQARRSSTPNDEAGFMPASPISTPNDE